MGRTTHTAKHRFDLLHALLIVIVSCAALIALVAVGHFGLQLPIEFE